MALLKHSERLKGIVIMITKGTVINQFYLMSKRNKKATLLLLLCALVSGIIPLYQVKILGYFIDEVNISNTYHKYSIALLIAIVSSYFITWLLNAYNDYLFKMLEMRLAETEKYELLSRCKNISLADLEDSRFHDLNKRVINKSVQICVAIYKNLMNIVSINVRFICTLLILFNYEKWIAVLLMLLIIPVFVFSYRAGIKNYIELKDLTRDERYVEYLSSMLVSRDCVYERSLFSFADFYNDIYDRKYENWKKRKMRIDFINLLEKNLGTVISVFAGIIIFWALFNSVIEERVTLGVFVSAIYIVYELSNMLSENLISIANEFAEIREYLKEMETYKFKAESNGVKNYLDRFDSLEFKNVSYKYSGSERYVLKNLNLKIENGKKYALVGLNGAGKTTLIKLALGLYDNYEGNILLNNVEITQYSRNQINRILSVLFQDFAKFSISVKENIFGNRGQCSLDAIEGIDVFCLQQLIDKLPQGINTELGKLTDVSYDLSGGEWQKIAFARLLSRNAPVLILDEPTAAVDPITESKLYTSFYNMTAGKTSIVISHRLGATKLYDNILVINDGHIVEKGTHYELLKRNGVYHDLYDSQKEWYL